MIESKPVNLLFKDLYDLQRHGVMVDTRLVLDDGELAIHWPILELYGDNWWTGLGWARLAVTMLSFSLEFPCQKLSSLLMFCMENKTS